MDAETQSTELYVRILEWLHAKQKMILMVVIALAVVGAAWGIYAWKKSTDQSDADARLFALPLPSATRVGISKPSEFLDVSKEYPSTPAGEYAKVLGAEELFTQGKYPEAYQEFSDFITAYPDSALVPQAKLGVAASLEAQGKDTDAINKYHEVIITYPTEMSIVSPAKLTVARLYQKINKLQDAFMGYAELANFLRQNPYDPWAGEARERAQLIAAEHPEYLQALTNAAASRSSTGGITLPPGSQPARAPMTAPSPTPAPKVPAPAAPTSGQVPQLLTMPNISTNTAKKP